MSLKNLNFTEDKRRKENGSNSKLSPDLRKEKREENKLWKESAQPKLKLKLNVKMYRLSVMLKLFRYYFSGLLLFSYLTTF